MWFRRMVLATTFTLLLIDLCITTWWSLLLLLMLCYSVFISRCPHRVCRACCWHSWKSPFLLPQLSSPVPNLTSPGPNKNQQNHAFLYLLHYIRREPFLCGLGLVTSKRHCQQVKTGYCYKSAFIQKNLFPLQVQRPVLPSHLSQGFQVLVVELVE